MEIITKETAQYIADTLGIALKDVFTIYSESIKTLALIDMVTSVLWVLMSLCVVIGGYYLDKSLCGEKNDTEISSMAAAAISFVVWLIFTIAIIEMNHYTSYYYCSDYYAIKELIGIVR